MIHADTIFARRGSIAWVALSPSEFVAMRPGNAELLRRPLPGVADIDAWADAVHGCLREIKTTATRTNGGCEFLLLPPLVQTKVVRLPRLSVPELRAVLKRDAEKYFPSNGQSIVVNAAHSTRSGTNGVLQPRVLTAAPERIIDAIATAVDAAGLTLHSISASTLCLGGIAGQPTPHADGSAIVACAYDGMCELIEVAKSTIVAIRRLHLNGDANTLVDAIARMRAECRSDNHVPGLFVVGNSENAIIPVREDSADHVGVLHRLLGHSDPAAVCVSRRTQGRSTDLLPTALAAQRRDSQWRQSVRSVVASLCVIASAFGYRVYHASSLLQFERARRAQLAAKVGESLRIKDTLWALQKEWALVRRGDSNDSGRRRSLAELATALPDDAMLLSIRLRADTLFVAGASANAEDVLGVLQSAPGHADARFVSPVEQVEQPDGSVSERFAIRAVLSTRRLVLAGTRPYLMTPGGH